MEFMIAIGVILLGWLLGHASGFIERRDQRQKAFRKILSDLLLARHRLKWALYYTESLAKMLPFPEEERGAMIAETISKMLSIEPEIRTRYSSALESLAEYEPVAAYHLQSKSSTEKFISSMQEMYSIAKTPILLKHALNHSAMIEKTILHQLDGYILGVAKRVGKREYEYAVDLMKNDIDPNPEFAAIVNSMIGSINDLMEKNSNKDVSIAQ